MTRRPCPIIRWAGASRLVALEQSSPFLGNTRNSRRRRPLVHEVTVTVTHEHRTVAHPTTYQVDRHFSELALFNLDHGERALDTINNHVAHLDLYGLHTPQGP